MKHPKPCQEDDESSIEPSNYVCKQVKGYFLKTRTLRDTTKGRNRFTNVIVTYRFVVK